MQSDSQLLEIPFRTLAQPLEHMVVASGTTCFCGVDEAGRGPLAGPVVAATVLYEDCPELWQARDSKQLSSHVRKSVYDLIVNKMVFAVGICDHEEIDRLNILQASLLAMTRAVNKLQPTPHLILVDGKYRLPIAIPSHAIVRGDARVAIIGAASIIAKVTRDRIMTQYDMMFPGYGFARHFGYPTAEHRKKISELGPCPIHRRTFRGIRKYLS